MSRSRFVVSNQPGLHPRLESTVRRHLDTPWQKPIAEHTRSAFAEAEHWLTERQELQAKQGLPRRPLVLDSCCGVGQSTVQLAEKHSQALVIGVDKSAQRLGRHQGKQANYLLLRADLNDFWRLAAQADWRLSHHYLLYPNPWPKSAHLKRRWHGAPVFPFLLQLGGRLELRSNWRLYLEEFAQALALAGRASTVCGFQPEVMLTPFEAKYHASAQPLWQLVSPAPAAPWAASSSA